MSPITNKSAALLIRRYHFLIAMVIVTVAFAFEGFFLYQYFYMPFITSKTLLKFKQHEALEELKMPLYESVLKFSKERQNLPAIDFATLKDPFKNITPESTAASTRP